MSSEEGQVEAILLMAGFTEVDENNDGYLTVEELRNALKNTELEKFVDLIVLKADADQNGKIDYRGRLNTDLNFWAKTRPFLATEFCKDVVPYLKEELKEVKAELKKAFEATDLNKDGWISEEEMWSAINSGRFTNWSNSDVQDALDKADKDELGRFNYERR